MTNTVGKNIYRIRTARNITQKQLAEAIGVSDKAVSRYENGEVSVTVELAKKIANFFDVDILKLISDFDDTVKTSDINPDLCSQKKRSTGTSLNLLKDEYTPNGNYLCTWTMQEKAAEILGLEGESCSELRDALDEKTLFENDRFYHIIPYKYRSSLIFLLDDGWDVQYGTKNSCAEDKIAFGSLIPDKEKFKSFGSDGEERLKNLCRKVGELGYAGLGLWISPQMTGERDAEDLETAREYWTEKAKMCHRAGVRYWKVDWGKCSRIKEYREMMTKCVKENAPGLLIEHAFELLPYEDEKEYKEKAKTIRKILKYSDYFRTYDVEEPFKNSETIFRVNEILKGFDPKTIDDCVGGYLNVESQVEIAQVLGFNVGIMEYSREVLIYLRWQSLYPAYSLKEGNYLSSDECVEDVYMFEKDPSWWLKCKGKTHKHSIPCAISRGCRLPNVRTDGIKPIVIAGKNPETGVYAVGTLGRVIDPNRDVKTLADVEMFVDEKQMNIGVFGFYKSLKLTLPDTMQWDRRTVWIQSITQDNAVNISDKVSVKKNEMLFDGNMLRNIWNENIEDLNTNPSFVIYIK